MPSRYDQLCELYNRADEQSTKRHDDAVALASALVLEVLSSFGVPNDLKSAPLRPGKSRPAVELCAVPWNDDEPIGALKATPATAAVITEDGELYKFGLVVRMYSDRGIAPHPVALPSPDEPQVGERF